MRKILSLLVLCCLIGCEEILYEENISTDKVMLLAPTNGVNMVAGEITFNWQPLNGATNYELQVATPNFANASQIELDTTLSNTNFTELLEANSYEWRVKGLNSAYETVYTTNAFEVMTQGEP